MGTSVPSNQFLNLALRGAALALKAAAEAAEASVGAVCHLLTHSVVVPGQSPNGVNPTCSDVVNQAELETIIAVDDAMKAVLRMSTSAGVFYRAVYPIIHQTVWERKRQSPIHRASVPGTYVPPP